MKKINLILFTFISALAVNAQQVGMYSHYFYKPMVYNPAFTGTGDATNVMFISRAQWSDFKGAPQLNIATVDGSLMNKNNYKYDSKNNLIEETYYNSDGNIAF